MSNKKQLAKLVEIMQTDLDLAKGVLPKDLRRTRWEKIADELNKHGPPIKNWDKWCRVWIDMKSKIKVHLSQNSLTTLDPLKVTVVKLLEMKHSTQIEQVEKDLEEKSISANQDEFEIDRWKNVSNKRQLAKLVELMQMDPDLAKGVLAKDLRQKRWEEIAKKLNKYGPPTKSWFKWCRVWIDMKSKIKSQLALNPLMALDPLKTAVVNLLNMKPGALRCESEKQVSTKKQLEKMVELLQKDQLLVKKLLPKNVQKEHWKLIANELNKMGPPTKTWQTWYRVWVDKKSKLKSKFSQKANNLNQQELALVKLLEFDNEVNTLENTSIDNIVTETSNNTFPGDMDGIFSNLAADKSIANNDLSEICRTNEKTREKTNKTQMAKLVELVTNDRLLATGELAKTLQQERWEEIAVKLNLLGPPVKNWKRWCRVWTDMKSKMKIRLSQKQFEYHTSGKDEDFLQSLTPLETTIAKVLEWRVSKNSSDNKISECGEEFTLKDNNNDDNDLSEYFIKELDDDSKYEMDLIIPNTKLLTTDTNSVFQQQQINDEEPFINCQTKVTMCRLCIFECTDGVVPIFNNQEESNLTKLIVKYLYLEINETDNFSTNICLNCAQQLRDIEKFVQNIENRQQVLNEVYLGNNQNKFMNENLCKNISIEKSQQETTMTKAINNENCFDSQQQEEILFNFKPNVMLCKDLDTDASERIEFVDNKDIFDIKQPVYTDSIEQTDNSLHEINNFSSTEYIIEEEEEENLFEESDSASIEHQKYESNSFTIEEKNSEKHQTIEYRNEDEIKRDEFIEKNILLKCEKCNIIFKEYKMYLTHFRIKHNLIAYVNCCGVRLNSTWRLNNHIKTHLNPDRFKCHICHQHLSNESNLQSHIGTYHTEKEQLKHGCEICNERFTSTYKLKLHMLVHEDGKKYVCEICNKAFKWKVSMLAHKKRNHGNITLHVCEHCGISTKYKQALEQHLALKHNIISNPAMKQCDECKEWLRAKCFKKHLERHILQDVKCTKCEKILSSNYALSKHNKHSCRFKNKKRISKT